MTTRYVNYSDSNTVYPGTVMQFTNPHRNNIIERVVVLTDNKVMYLMLGNDTNHREVMALPDWLIVAQGCPITMNPIESSQVDSVIADAKKAIPYPSFEEQVEKGLIRKLYGQQLDSMPEYKIGTKLSWKIDENNRHVGVVTKDGLLVVLEMINGHKTPKVEGHKNGIAFYSNIREWFKSLPPGNDDTNLVAHYTPTHKEMLKSMPIVATSDIDIVSELLLRWRISTYGRINPSQIEMVANQENLLANAMREKEELDPTMPGYRILRTRKVNAIRKIRNGLSLLQHRLNLMKTLEQRNTKYACVFDSCKTNLYAKIDGQYRIITMDRPYIIAAGYANNEYYQPNRYGPTFASLGVEMKANGKPDLMVKWMRREVFLNE